MTTGRGRCETHKWTTFSDEVTGKFECVRCLHTKDTFKGLGQSIAKHFLERAAEAKGK